MSLLALALVAIAACASNDPTPTPTAAEAVATVEEVANEVAASYPIASSSWDLAFFGPPEASLPVMPDTRASVTYFIDRYAGFDGCNWFLGVYQANADGTMTNYSPSQTRILCEGDLGEQGGTFVSALLNVTNWAMEGEQLLQNTVDDQRLLTFNPAQVVPTPGTRWQLKFWMADESEDWGAAFPGSDSHITFGEDGQATGSGGCNDFTAPYTGDLQVEMVMASTPTSAELPSLTIGEITYDPETCDEPEGIMTQEQGFLAALSEVAQYYKLGGVLLLLDAEGEPIMLLGAAD